MTDKHPITPPPNLAYQWRNDAPALGRDVWISTQAARWGADQELEACCTWLSDHGYIAADPELRAARRPKPPTLKEQALYALDEAESGTCLHLNGLGDTIRRALEALPND